MNNLPRLSALLFFILTSLLVSCDKQADKPLVKNTPSPMMTDMGLMQIINLQQWPQVRQQYRGNIVVADLWASWCVSCIERFPAMVELSQKYKDNNVQFISLNLDDPNDKEAIEWSEKFLLKMNAEFPHYHMRENLMISFEQLDLLGIPVVLIYDKTGNEYLRLTGDNPNKQFSENDVEEAIIRLAL